MIGSKHPNLPIFESLILKFHEINDHADESTENSELPVTPSKQTSFEISSSLNFALIDTTTISMKYSQLDDSPEFLAKLPVSIRKNIKFIGVTDYDSNISPGNLETRIPDKQGIETRRWKILLELFKNSNIRLQLDEFDLKKLKMNDQATLTVISEIVQGNIKTLNSNFIDYIIIPLGSKLKSVNFEIIADEAIQRIFELQHTEIRFPDLTWGYLDLKSFYSPKVYRLHLVQRFSESQIL
jgi:hypothetical protein